MDNINVRSCIHRKCKQWYGRLPARDECILMSNHFWEIGKQGTINTIIDTKLHNHITLCFVMGIMGRCKRTGNVETQWYWAHCGHITCFWFCACCQFIYAVVKMHDTYRMTCQSMLVERDIWYSCIESSPALSPVPWWGWRSQDSEDHIECQDILHRRYSYLCIVHTHQPKSCIYFIFDSFIIITQFTVFRSFLYCSDKHM